MSNTEWSPEIVTRLRELKREGFSAAQIGRLLDLPEHEVDRRLNALRNTIRTHTKRLQALRAAT